MEPSSVVLLSLAAAGGSYRAWTNPPADNSEVKWIIRETIRDTVAYGITIGITEWLAGQKSKFLRGLAWTPVVMCVLVTLAHLLALARFKVKEDMLLMNPKSSGSVNNKSTTVHKRVKSKHVSRKKYNEII